MLKNVRVKVLRDTQERQIPWVNTSMVVNFVFNPGAGALAAAVRSPGPRAPASVPAGPVVEANAGRRTLRLASRAERSLNTDRAQASASLALRVYVLRDASGLRDAQASTRSTSMTRRRSASRCCGARACTCAPAKRASWC